MSAPIKPESFASFGELLRFLRRRAGLTQEELGRAVGYTGAHVGRLEQNQRLPDLDTLAARFVAALMLEDEPATVARLLALAASARGEPLPAGYTVTRAEGPPAPPPAVTAASAADPDAAGNLPPALSSFVGRERELLEVRRLVAGARLVTLLGTGGSGKTRLALEAAARLQSLYPHGVWLVELAPLTDPALVPTAVAVCLGVPVPDDAAVLPALTQYLRGRETLLILDNCEHLIAAAAALAEAVLRDCPHACVLATSREALGAAGEAVYRVPPLSLPERRAVTAQALARSEAARLFVERAQAAQQRFTVTDANAPAIAAICRRVDGLPLALELAAARVGALGVDQIAARLAAHGGLRLLTGGRRTAQARQQTLEALIAWSYVLLTAAECALLRQLAVFADSWTLAAAEALGGADALAALTGLVDKSLVAVDEDEAGGVMRYRLLEPIRQFARARLAEAGEWAAAHNRHLAYYAAWMEDAVAHLESAAQLVWLERIEAEDNNVRAALDWALEPGADFGAGLRLAAAALGEFALVRGHLGEGLERARAFLRRADPERDALPRARLLAWAAQLAYFHFEGEQARVWSDEAVALCRALDEREGLAEALWAQGVTASWTGDEALALAALEECVALCRALGNPYKLAFGLVDLGRVQAARKQPGARALIEEGLALATRHDDTWGLAYALRMLGDLLNRQGDYAAARVVYERSLPVARLLGERVSQGMALANLALVTHLLADHAACARYAAEALALYRAMGDDVQPPFVLRMLGYAALHQGDLAAARQHFAESLRGNRALGHIGGQLACLLGLAGVAAARGESEVAARLGGAVAALAPAAQVEFLAPDAQALAQLAECLGGTAAWAAGGALTLAQAAALAEP